MADFTVEAKRVKAGQSLTDMNNQGMGAIAQLKQIKINIIALSAQVAADTDYIQADTDAINAVATALLAEIATI